MSEKRLDVTGDIVETLEHMINMFESTGIMLAALEKRIAELETQIKNHEDRIDNLVTWISAHDRWIDNHDAPIAEGGDQG